MEGRRQKDKETGGRCSNLLFPLSPLRKLVLKNSCTILNPFNIRENVEIGEEKTKNPPNFERRMPRKSCQEKSILKPILN